MTVEDNLYYSTGHQWIDAARGDVRVSITAFAADALGDVLHLALPAVDTRITAGVRCGEIESAKSFSDLRSPVGGVVTAVNVDTQIDPGLVNHEPCGGGWLFRVYAESAVGLLTRSVYEAYADE